MKTSQFEAVKVALKQDKTGHVLTLSIHPDEVPDEILRDFVGARYQVVMVRLNDNNTPMDRNKEHGDAVQLAGILCREIDFHRFLHEAGQIMEATEKDTVEWLKEELSIASRTELKSNAQAAKQLRTINEEYKAWKRKN
jgi:hypothetical protein